jgi:uncharacterized ubiquitin-like protein YukD
LSIFELVSIAVDKEIRKLISILKVRVLEVKENKRSTLMAAQHVKNIAGMMGEKCKYFDFNVGSGL